MQRICAYIFFGAILISANAQTTNTDFLGPVELQDTFLPAQVRPQSYPESARVREQGKWTANVTLDWAADLAKTDTYLFDGETVTTTLKLRFVPFQKFEIGVDVPYADRLDGSLDQFIEFVETNLQQKVLARYELPQDTYQAFVGTTNQTELLLHKGSGFRDITLHGKYQLLDSDTQHVDLAAVATLGLPTGDANFGGEGFTPGAGLHFQKPFRHINYFLGGAANCYTDSTEQRFRLNHWRGMAYAGFDTRWSWYGCAVEYQVYSALAEGHAPLDELTQYWTVTPVRLYLGRVIFEAGVVENSFFGMLENRNGSDAVFKFSMTGKF